MDFYSKIIELCQQKGVSRSKMADDIGISRSAPQGWAEKGAVPRFATMKKIADYFGIPVEYLYDTDPAAQIPSAPEAQKEKPTVQDDELSDKRKALIDVAVNATGDTLDLLLRVAQSITGSN